MPALPVFVILAIIAYAATQSLYISAYVFLSAALIYFLKNKWHRKDTKECLAAMSIMTLILATGLLAVLVALQNNVALPNVKHIYIATFLALAAVDVFHIMSARKQRKFVNFATYVMAFLAAGQVYHGYTDGGLTLSESIVGMIGDGIFAIYLRITTMVDIRA